MVFFSNKKRKLTCQIDILKLVGSYEDGSDGVDVRFIIAVGSDFGQLCEVDNGKAIRTVRVYKLLRRGCTSDINIVLVQID
jgi:hypothetical protein